MEFIILSQLNRRFVHPVLYDEAFSFFCQIQEQFVNNVHESLNEEWHLIILEEYWLIEDISRDKICRCLVTEKGEKKWTVEALLLSHP